MIGREPMKTNLFRSLTEVKYAMSRMKKLLAQLCVVGALALSLVAAPAVAETNSAQAAVSVQISCKYTGGVTSCNMIVPGGYCGSGRGVGVGVTTHRKGGIIVSAPLFKRISWQGGQTRSYSIYVGTTFTAVVTMEGNTTTRPYPTCSLG